MTNVLKVAIVVSIIAISTGCQQKISGGSDLEHATVVSSSEFKEAVQQHFFLLIGCDETYHYCVAEDGFYRLKDDQGLFPPEARRFLERWKPGEEGFGTGGFAYRLNGDHLERPPAGYKTSEAIGRHLGWKISKVE